MRHKTERTHLMIDLAEQSLSLAELHETSVCTTTTDESCARPPRNTAISAPCTSIFKKSIFDISACHRAGGFRPAFRRQSSNRADRHSGSRKPRGSAQAGCSCQRHGTGEFARLPSTNHKRKIVSCGPFWAFRLARPLACGSKPTTVQRPRPTCPYRRNLSKRIGTDIDDRCQCSGK